jgi:hypothetical protein
VCGFDAVGEMLQFVLGNLKKGKISKLNPMEFNWKDKGVLREFA